MITFKTAKLRIPVWTNVLVARVVDSQFKVQWVQNTLSSIKWVPGNSVDLVVKSKMSLDMSFTALRQLNPIHDKGS